MTRLHVVKGEAETPGDPVQAAALAAVTAALADGMVLGVIVYETREGTNGRAPILAGRSAIRGLCEDTLDDLAAERAEP